MILKMDAFLRDLAQFRQRKNLVAAAVGQDRSVPIHEAMQAADRPDHLEPWPDEQMIRISENDLRFEFPQLARTHRLHAALGADGHERRRLDYTVRCLQATATRFCVLIARP